MYNSARKTLKLRRIGGKFAVTSLMLILVIILFIQFALPKIIEAHEPVKVLTVVVEYGDSLWKIADKYDNNKMDLRKYIYLIEEFNELDKTLLQPGQRLKIPIYN